MNTVKKCSISGIAFTLDADAYETLSAYLESLRTRYAGHRDGDEIVADIEARIAELILSTQDGSRTVELPLVKNIMAQMGSPEEIGDSEEKSDTDGEPQPGNPKKSAPRIPRRLYRDPEDAKLGGVCTGLGAYFDLDPVLVRLIFFAPLFVAIIARIIHIHKVSEWVRHVSMDMFGLFILGYIIMWFVVPAARTARQRLEMKGERITSDSIGSETAGTRSVDGYPKNVVASTVSVFGTVVLILLKLFAGMIVAGLAATASGLLLGLFCLLLMKDQVIGLASVSVGVTGILCVLVFCLLMIYVLMCLILSRRPSGRWVLGAFFLWLLTICLLAASVFVEFKNGGIEGIWRSDKMLEELVPNGCNLLEGVDSVEDCDAGFDADPELFD